MTWTIKEVNPKCLPCCGGNESGTYSSLSLITPFKIVDIVGESSINNECKLHKFYLCSRIAMATSLVASNDRPPESFMPCSPNTPKRFCSIWL